MRSRVPGRYALVYPTPGAATQKRHMTRLCTVQRDAVARPAPERDDAPVTASASLPIVPEWFSVTWVTGATAYLTEPHVDGLLRANIWYLRGRERDLIVDTGNGIAPLAPVVERLARGSRRPVVAVATHAHIDHIGGFHEFEHRLLHPL